MGEAEQPEDAALAAAYHEAGHYLVSRLLRRSGPSVSLGGLSVRPEADSAGRLLLGFDARGPGERCVGFPAAATATLESVLVWIYLAGREAQWIGTGVRPQRGHLEDWIESRLRTIRQCYPDVELLETAQALTADLAHARWDDVRDRLDALTRTYPVVRPLLHRRQAQVRALLQRNRAALDALAEALRQRGGLTVAEADAILDAFELAEPAPSELDPGKPDAFG